MTVPDPARLASPAGVASEAVEPSAALDTSCWEVEVRVGGESILVIGHNHLSGLYDIEPYADRIRDCAEHLLSFIGPAEPSPCFGCGGTGRERWMGPCGEEVGPCSVCGDLEDATGNAEDRK